MRNRDTHAGSSGIPARETLAVPAADLSPEYTFPSPPRIEI
jgi:hypothetical protein